MLAWTAWSNAPGWVTEFQHPAGYVPYVDPKPEEMQEFVWGCGYLWILWIFDFFVRWSEIVWPLVCEVFHPQLGSLVACRLGGSVAYYQHVWRSMKLWVSQNTALKKLHKLYLSSRGGTSNAFKVFCSELTYLCRCNGLTVLAQALAKHQNYAKKSISAQDFLCAVGSDFAHRYWHCLHWNFGLGSRMLFHAALYNI